MSYTIITDNEKQFTDRKQKEFYNGLDIKHLTSFVEHPQMNGQVEATNKVIINELKNRVDKANGRWVEELPEILWTIDVRPNSL